MPLDEATRRLAFLLERDLRRMTDRERARAERGEVVHFDSVSRMATWQTRSGEVIGRWYGEIVATWMPPDRILRWAWAGRAPIATATHSELMFREGQARAVPQLSMSVVADLDEEDACTLVRLGVLVARGDGMLLVRSEQEVVFVGLFDSPRPREGQASDPSRYSVPSPAVSPRASSSPAPAREGREPSSPPAKPTRSSPPGVPRRSSPPAAPYRSLPPITEIYDPRNMPKGHGAHRSPAEERPPPVAPIAEQPAPSQRPQPSSPPERKIREPARAIFVPVATSVLSALAKSAPGYQQALFVVTVIHPESSAAPEQRRRRLVVNLVAVDASGVLRALDPSHELVEATVRMVEADQADGNGPWRKLSARITPKPDGGATLNVDVI
jgi:hypothetical protein